MQIDGLSIFYREAGPKDAPTLLLLHGVPTSSRQFEPLLARLSDRYHLVAPDYPGFGHSDWPDPKKFAYTFDHLAEVLNHFTEALGISRYTLYMHDYGGPVGFRMALAHPERVRGADRPGRRRARRGTGRELEAATRLLGRPRRERDGASRGLSLPAGDADPPRRERPPRGALRPGRLDRRVCFLNQPSQADIQSDLFYDYRTNVDAYPKWQAWMRERKPRLLVLWGKYDLSFESSEPENYRRDVPAAQVHVVEAGHFALDTAADQIAELVRGFLE